MNRKPPKSFWVVLDPVDGAHVFTSELKAKAALSKWEEQAKGDADDSVWSMSEPLRYVLEKKR